MRKSFSKRPNRKIAAFLPVVALLALFPALVQGQQLNIREFVVFGGNSTQIGTSTTISGGRIGSNQLVTTMGNTNISASIHSANRIQLANSNTITGDISAQGTTGTPFSTGSNFSFPTKTARIDVGGNVVIQSGSISGTLYMPTTSSYSGPRLTRKSPPSFPTMPSLPTISQFRAPGAQNITSSTSLDPNISYGDMNLNGNKTVVFSGTGVYTFKSIKISNSDNQLVLDFKGNTTGFIVIQVHNDADLDKLNVKLINEGHPSRVYTEVHGLGTTSPSGTDAWRIANGSSGTNNGIWYGAVWAPYGGIFVGQGSTPSKIEGVLWSGTNVTLASGVAVTYVRPTECGNVIADAGPDKTINCKNGEKETTIGTVNSTGTSYQWTTIVNGAEKIVGSTKSITVTTSGTYTLTVGNQCGNTVTDQVEVDFITCVIPVNENPGKVENLIGHELTYLKQNLEEAKKHFIIIGNESIFIEAVAVDKREQDALEFLNKLGLRDSVIYGDADQLITGLFPIDNLPIVNEHPELFNHFRPVFRPEGNVGRTTSEGDRAMASDLARSGFNVGGERIKVGVISDSYNKREQGVNYALQDIQNGDLPGTGNTIGNTTPVDVIQDYPYGLRTDEGRAMLQIVHDVAPKAELAFGTGFISPAHMAQMIRVMSNRGCKVIVDDVTYPTEPFFQDGVVARAVDEVAQAGIAYFTSAGNFGQKSFTSQFNGTTAPNGLTGQAHNFGGSIYQRLQLKSGTYTIVLQWQDNIYSLAQTTGTQNDLDIYLVDQGGRTGFNRNNLNGDPFEVLSFSIDLQDTSRVVDIDLLITKANTTGGGNPLFKYIIFRGNAIIATHTNNQTLQDKSTIVGHANAKGAIAVGAVLFSNTPPYDIPQGSRNFSIASFSSTGGTPVYRYVNGSLVSDGVRNKPEIIAPNGVNTSSTAPMGPDIDFVTDRVNGTQDTYPNFFGTSASAPHAAAAAALLMTARDTFYRQSLNLNELRNYMFTTAIPMHSDEFPTGWNYKAGNGLVQPFAAIRAFANPIPQIKELVYDTDKTPGEEEIELKVKGEFLQSNSTIYLRDQPLETTYNSADSSLEATIKKFTGNPSIKVFTPSMGTTNKDGGFSNERFFFTKPKLTVVVKADNKTKMYGEVLPQNTSTIFVEGDSLRVYNEKHGTMLTRTSLGLDEDNIQFRYSDPSMNAYSTKGFYTIFPHRKFDLNNPTDVGLLEIYKYDSTQGDLTINKLPVTITPQNFVVEYGGPLNNNIQFNYVFPQNATLENKTTLTNIIRSEHEANVNNEVLGVMNNIGGTGVIFFQNRMLPVYSNAVIIYENKMYPLLNRNGTAVVILNIGNGYQEYPVVNGKLTGGAAVILNDIEYPVINGGGAVVIFNGEIIPVTNRTDGSAVVILNGETFSVTRKSDGSAVVILNDGKELPVVNGTGGAVVIVNGQYYPVINRTGGAVVIFNGTEYPVVNGVKTGGAAVILNDQEYPVQNALRTAATILNGQYYEVIANTKGSASVILNGQVQAGSVPYLNGVGGGAAVIINGKIEPVFNRIGGGAVVILNGTILPVINRIGGAVVILNGQEYPFNIINKTDGTGVVILNGQEYPVVNGAGGAAVVLNGTFHPVTNRVGGGAVVILNDGKEYAVVNGVSPTTLSNMSMSATLNAIANKRTAGAELNFIDLSANAFAQFITNSSNMTMFNTFASVNRTLVDANRLANGEPVIVNTRGSAVTILNGSGAYVNSNTLSSTAVVRTPVIFDQADLNSATGTGSVAIEMKGINMITGINSGEQYMIPATLFSPNFEISYEVGNVNILKAPLNLQANNATKEFGQVIGINPAGFNVISGNTKYQEKISLAVMTSAGTAANAAAGTYSINISNALGSYGTDMNNYSVTYTNGTLTVVAPSCPVITHSRNNSFVNTTTRPVSLWLSVAVKVRGQLTKPGDYLIFKEGELVLENISYQNSSEKISVKKGIVIAVQGLTSPSNSYFDSQKDAFITEVPVGFNSTADIFITGAIINSATGFIKGKNAGSVLKGIFQSNVAYNGQWNYAMAAYSALPGPVYVDYIQLENTLNRPIVAMSSSSDKAGTPIPWKSRITAGGTGNGGTNYTGSPSNNDNFSACVISSNNGQQIRTPFIVSKEFKEQSANINELVVFPNPASSFVNLSFVPVVKGAVTLRVYTADGALTKNIYQGLAEANQLYTKRIDTQSWPKGIYTIQLTLKDQVINRKLVIIR